METQTAVTLLAGLAHPTRLEVFRLLVRAGDEGLPAGELARHLDLPPPTLSFHLKELRTAGLVAAHRRGRHVVYQVEFTAIRTLVAFLTEECCAGLEPSTCTSEEAR
ncbi:MAG TPA: ArsR family transcriptional regulator [Actinobacteria bacterium]|nr:ArsR family transcriptional regulator [Actinomycetota bacterium]